MPQYTQLTEALLQEGTVSQSQLAEAELRSGRTGEPFLGILAEIADLSPDQMLHARAAALGIAAIVLADVTPDEAALAALPQCLAERHTVFPVRLRDGVLELAMADPEDVFALDDVRRCVGAGVRPLLAVVPDIEAAIDRHYGGNGSAAPTSAPAEAKAPQPSVRQSVLADLVERAPVIRILDSVIESAVRERASDIHVERQAEGLCVRLRVDGVLYDYLEATARLHAPLISRIKIVGGMNISERRLPQDGRFSCEVDGHEYDVRVSTVPSARGEKAVLRLLPKSHELLRLEDLGLTPEKRALFEDLIARAFGIIIVAGPTGSGKTTTLYAALDRIDKVGRNVITIEDPVEYAFKRVTQIQVKPQIGLTFASGLRSVLRQDPDVILVGEIRDEETLRMAVQAALTGHLVFSTLHCNDAGSAASRMIDMGLEPYLLTSAVIGCISQRLVRRICPRCKEPVTPSADVRARLKLNGGEGPFHRGAGCDRCRHTGYFGRVGVFEVMPMTEPVRRAILHRPTASDVRRIAAAEGMESMRTDGIRKACDELTTLEEVLRAVYIEDD